MTDQPVGFSAGGLPETVLDPEPIEVRDGLARANGESDVAAVAASYPRSLSAWATLAELAATRGADIEAYAYARVGYHRGLDHLRQAGWRGAGYVRWQHETNQGFLRALAALQAVAARIGERDEALRCAEFLHQLDPGQFPLAQ